MRTSSDVFDMFPRLKERRSQAAGTMSGGEQQMLAVARGIMAEPEVLMIDELSLGLAPMLAVNLFEKLLALKNLGLTMLLVEQNVQLALKISDYAYVLREGQRLHPWPGRRSRRQPGSAYSVSWGLDGSQLL